MRFNRQSTLYINGNGDVRPLNTHINDKHPMAKAHKQAKRREKPILGNLSNAIFARSSSIECKRHRTHVPIYRTYTIHVKDGGGTQLDAHSVTSYTCQANKMQIVCVGVTVRVFSFLVYILFATCQRNKDRTQHTNRFIRFDIHFYLFIFSSDVFLIVRRRCGSTSCHSQSLATCQKLPRNMLNKDKTAEGCSVCALCIR